MNNVWKTSLCFALCMVLVACAPPSASATPASPWESTAAFSPGITPTSTAGSKQQPTIIPTIESSEVPERLKNIGIENPGALNGHALRKITGWSNGFNSGHWDNDFAGYQWMDNDHLLLFPVTGEHSHPNGRTIDARAVVINLDQGNIWLPPVDQPEGNRMVMGLLPYWSPTLGILITSHTSGSGYGTSRGVTTFNANGDIAARYWGDLIGVSPSGTKILIADDSWVDLETGKITDFNWYVGARPRFRALWSEDETRVYICCYFYGDGATGESYYLSDESTILDGHPDDNSQTLHHSHGMWLNDNFVLAQFDGFSTYRYGSVPVFDISGKTFRNLGVLAGLPDAFNTMPNVWYNMSPDGDYMWIDPGLQSPTDPQTYLVDLQTLKSQLYRSNSAGWSVNGQYAMLDAQVLTLSTKQLRPIPPYPEYRYHLDDAWHPADGVFASIRVSEDKRTHTLFMLNVEDMTREQVALPPIFLGDFLRPILFWNPQGDHIALLAADNSLWQMDYPALNTMEQLTPPMPDAKDILWSPDGTHISFISGADIYIVDARNAP